MKELSIEEKAKAYDKALERAKNTIEVNQTIPNIVECVESLFPELKESEDEKIRKELLNAFKEATDSLYVVLTPSKREAFIAWLEKQGDNASDKIVEKARTEKQKVLLTETDGSASIDWDCRSLDDVKVLLKCGLDFIHDVEASKQILTDSRFGGCSLCVPTRYDKGIKQGEQKPADKVEPKFKVGDIISNGISEVKIVSIDKNNYNVTNGEIENDAHAGNWVIYFKDQDNWELVKQKSWSEEDERILESILKYYPLMREEWVNWLKSFKERVQLK